LNQLSRGAPHETGVVVRDDLWRVLRAADRLSRQSDGAFDVTVGPLTKLWRRARRQKVLPDRGRLQSALDAVGYQLVSFDEQRRAVKLGRPQMQLDLGGIAKGYAVDEALRVLASRGIDRALVNGGGDLAVTAPPPGQSGWQIDTGTLDEKTPGRRLEVHHAAVATSGDIWQFVEIDGVRYSHILNPHTGLGITRRCSVTVVAPTCMLADGLASAVSVLGPDAGIALVETQPDTEAVVFEAAEVRDDKKIERHASRGFDQLLVPK
jgi:thiamine biosynthesis lipoprotein